jgi:hypothetical protein
MPDRTLLPKPRIHYLPLILLAAGWQSGALSAAALNQPDCAALTRWARALDPAANFSPVDGITVNRRFEDAVAQPLFGVTFMNWQNDDTTALQSWLNGCRQEAAGRKDTEASNALYAMLKETRSAYKQLRQVWSAQKMVKNTVDRLAGLKPDEGSAKVLAMAASALRGEDVSAELEALPRNWYGYGRQAAEISNFAPLLTEETRAEFLATLEQAGSSAEAAVAERSAAQQALVARIAAVPATQAGLNELYAISREVDAASMSREDYAAYDAALQNKRQWVQRQLEAEAAAEEARRRSLPAPAVARVDALLSGEDVEDLEFAGLPLNAPRSRLAQTAQNQWGFKQAPTMSLDETEYAVTRRDMDNYLKSERRNGGALRLRTHRGLVGEIRFSEHFPGPIPLADLEAYLRERFGKPDERSAAPNGYLVMHWQEGDRLLQVEAGPRIAQHFQNAGVQSSMALRLQDADFVDYLEDAGKRCQRLSEKPRDKLSQSEATALAMRCLEP